LLLADGSRTAEGTWDYVERPVGLDAVVVALFRRRSGRVEVLLRHGVRIPVQFGRPQRPESLLFPELVAGIVETGEDLSSRAAGGEASLTAALRASSDASPFALPWTGSDAPGIARRSRGAAAAAPPPAAPRARSPVRACRSGPPWSRTPRSRGRRSCRGGW